MKPHLIIILTDDDLNISVERLLEEFDEFEMENPGIGDVLNAALAKFLDEN